MKGFDFNRIIPIIDVNIIDFGPGVLFFLLGVIFVLIWGLSLGRTRALVSLLSIYIAFVLKSTFPYFEYVSRSLNLKYDIKFIEIGLFFAAYIVVFAILNKSLVKVRLSIKETSIFIIGLISVLQLGLLISIISNDLPQQFISKIPASTLPFFFGPLALFVWFFIPIIAILFIKKD